MNTFVPFAIGAVVGACTVLEIARMGRAAEVQYRIEHGCCGHIGLVCHKTLRSKERTGDAVLCKRCVLAHWAQKRINDGCPQSGDVARVATYLASRKTPVPRRVAREIPNNYWPRPPSLAGEAPIIWGNQS